MITTDAFGFDAAETPDQHIRNAQQLLDLCGTVHDGGAIAYSERDVYAIHRRLKAALAHLEADAGQMARIRDSLTAVSPLDGTVSDDDAL